MSDPHHLRLRWHLHELDPGLGAQGPFPGPARDLGSGGAPASDGVGGTVAGWPATWSSAVRS